MPKTKSAAGQRKSKVDTTLSTRTKKQIDSLPEHAQHIFKKAHANAVKHIKILRKDAEVRAKVLKKWLIKRHRLLSSRNTRRKVMNG